MKDNRRRNVVLGAAGVFSVASLAALAAWTASESVGTQLGSGEFGLQVATAQDRSGEWAWQSGTDATDFAEIGFGELFSDLDWAPGDTHAAPVALRLAPGSTHPALISHRFDGAAGFDDAFIWEYEHAGGAAAPDLDAGIIGDGDYAFALMPGQEVYFELTVEADDIARDQDVTGIWTFTAGQQTEDWDGSDAWRPDTPAEHFHFNGGIISGYDSTAGPSDVVIPAEIDGEPVTSIGVDAFRTKNLTSVRIPDSVTSIGEYAFAWNTLAAVTIPDSVTSMGSYVFLFNDLTSVTLGNSVTSIGQGAFNTNQLTEVTIPDSVTSIGHQAFGNNQLTTVTIGNSVTSIGDSAFSPNQLTEVTIPDSVTSIGHQAFRNNPLKLASVHADTQFSFNAFPTTTDIRIRD